MAHPAQADEVLKIAGNKLWAIVRDDPRRDTRDALARRLQHDLDLRRGHTLFQRPVHDKTAITAQHTAQIIERTGDIEIRDVNMPVLMRRRRLLKALPF